MLHISDYCILHTDHYSSTFTHKTKSGSIIMSSLRSKVDETRHRSRATPIAVEEEDSRMNLLPDVDIENHATEKRKRDRAMAIDEDEVNKKSCKYKTSASPLLIVSQDSTTAQDDASSPREDSITQDDEEASSLSDRVAKYLSSEYQLEKQEEDISFVCGYEKKLVLPPLIFIIIQNTNHIEFQRQQ